MDEEREEVSRDVPRLGPRLFSSKFIEKESYIRRAEKYLKESKPVPSHLGGKKDMRPSSIKKAAEKRERRRRLLEARERQMEATEVEQKQYETLLQESSFNDMDYSELSLKPGIPFFDVLVRKPSRHVEKNQVTRGSLLVNIPHTFVLGVDDYMFHLYTGDDGHVYRKENVSNKSIIRTIRNNSDDNGVFPAVVVKKQVYGEGSGSDHSVMTIKQLETFVENPPSVPLAIQQFVPSRGGRPSITRVVWVKNGNSYAYVYSNTDSYGDMDLMANEELRREFTTVPDDTNARAVNLYKTTNPSAISELSSICHNIVSQAEKIVPTVQISSVVIDFTRSASDGEWMLLQVKAYKGRVRPKMPPGWISHDKSSSKTKSISFLARESRIGSCKSCFGRFPITELRYSMTLKMIYDTEKHLRQRGVHLEWFDRSEYNIVTDSATWYRPSKVCKECFDLFITEQRLIDVERDFAKAIGVSVGEHGESRPVLPVYSRMERSVLEKRPPNYLVLHEMIVFLYGVSDFPLQALHPERIVEMGGEKEWKGSVGRGKHRISKRPMSAPAVRKKESANMRLEFTIFGQTTTIPVRQPPVKLAALKESSLCAKLPVNKMRVLYFFCDSDVYNLPNFLRKREKIKISFYTDKFLFGEVDIPLNQFISGTIDQLELNSSFSNSKCVDLCSLHLMLGFVRGEPVRSSELDLKLCENVWVPPISFCASHPLPDSWMSIIPDVAHSKSNNVTFVKRARPTTALRSRRSTSIDMEDPATETDEALGILPDDSQEEESKEKKKSLAKTYQLSIQVHNAIDVSNSPMDQWSVSYDFFGVDEKEYISVPFLRTKMVVFESEDSVWIECEDKNLRLYWTEFPSLRINVAHIVRPIRKGYATVESLFRLIDAGRIDELIPIHELDGLETEGGSPRLSVSLFLTETWSKEKEDEIRRKKLAVAPTLAPSLPEVEVDTTTEEGNRGKAEETDTFVHSFYPMKIHKSGRYMDIPPGIRIWGISEQLFDDDDYYS